MAIATGQEFGEDEEIQRPEGAHRKCSHRVNHLAAPAEEKKKRRLQRLSCLEQDVGPSTLFLGDGPMSTIPDDNAGGCDDVQAAGGVLDEEEEEEEEIPLIRKNSRHYRGATFLHKPCQHLLAFKGCQYLILTKRWKRSSLKTFYQSLLKLTISPSV
jgi:hypothetical protein